MCKHFFSFPIFGNVVFVFRGRRRRWRPGSTENPSSSLYAWKKVEKILFRFLNNWESARSSHWNFKPKSTQVSFREGLRFSTFSLRLENKIKSFHCLKTINKCLENICLYQIKFIFLPCQPGPTLDWWRCLRGLWMGRPLPLLLVESGNRTGRGILGGSHLWVPHRAADPEEQHLVVWQMLFNFTDIWIQINVFSSYFVYGKSHRLSLFSFNVYFCMCS